MSDPPTKLPAPARLSATLLAIAEVARGRPAGLLRFANTPQAVLAAMTPLVAFMLVGGTVALLSPQPRSIMVLADVALALLGSLVVSYEVAARWGRGDRWPRYAVAYCWCQWAAPVALAVTVVLMAGLIALGIPGDVAQEIGMLALLAYAFWLHWFLARHALGLSTGRSIALVLLVSVATAALMAVPDYAYLLLNGPPPA